MLNRVGDVEKAQGYLKEANNRNAALARENDALRAENDRLRLRVGPPRPRPSWRRYAACEGAFNTRGWSFSALIASSRSRYGLCMAGALRGLDPLLTAAGRGAW